MTTIMKAFKIRVYPSSEQRRLFAQSEGACRYVRNRVLREMAEFHREKGEYKSVLQMNREVTQWKKSQETSWLAEIPSDPINQEMRDLDTAFKHFFAKRAKYPKKKRKLFACSIRFVFDHRHAGKVRAWAERQVILPVLGRVKLAQPERLPAAMPKLITLSRDAADRYFISFAVETKAEPLPATGVSLGLDLGIKSLAVDSTGAVYRGAQALKRKLRYLRRQQRFLSRKVGARKGQTPSNRFKRQARRVGRLYARITDMRRDALHKVSLEIVRKADVIALENLNVRGMVRNRRLARHIADQGFSELRRQITYKAGWYGKVVLLADRWAPSTKMCSGCGQLHEMPLGKRVMACDCGLTIDRDHNAAINILTMCTGGNSGIDARGQGKNLSDPSGSPESSDTLDETRTKRGHEANRKDREAA